MAKRLTTEQKERVKLLLSEDPSSKLFTETLALVESSSEIAHVASKYAWDANGEDKLERILNHPLCDKGTVLAMYWRGDPEFFIEQKLEELHSTKQNIYKFLKKLESLYLADEFDSNEFKFDPMERKSEESRFNIAISFDVPDQLLIKNYGILQDNLDDLEHLRRGTTSTRLVTVKAPKPEKLRGGWAALAAISALANDYNFVNASKNEWFYCDGGGNWACLRFVDESKALLLGFDHEFSKTALTEASVNDSTLLKGAPSWWAESVFPVPDGDIIGFVYGWENNKWQRTSYNEEDGFDYVGLLHKISLKGQRSLSEMTELLIGPVSRNDLAALIKADANVSEEDLSKIYNENIGRAVEAARSFLKAPV